MFVVMASLRTETSEIRRVHSFTLCSLCFLIAAGREFEAAVARLLQRCDTTVAGHDLDAAVIEDQEVTGDNLAECRYRDLVAGLKVELVEQRLLLGDVDTARCAAA